MHASSYYRVSILDSEVVEVARESYDNTSRNVSESEVSPDGQLTVFLREDSDCGFILSSLKDDTLCAEELSNVYGFTWSPDSSAILFYANDKKDHTKSDLWLFDTGSQNCLQVLNNSGIDSSCTWSPDSMHFIATALVTEPAWGYAFYLINRDEARCKHLVNHIDFTGEDCPSRPAWSTDGRFLAISARPSNDSPDFKLYVFNNKGELLHELLWRDEHFSRIDEIVWRPTEMR